ERMEVSQQLHYRISYEPQRVFELAIPAELQQASGLYVAYEDQLLPLEPVDAEPSIPAAAAYRFVAPRDLIGNCSFTVKYAMPQPLLPQGERTPIHIPLPTPADRDDSEFSNHSITVDYADTLQLDALEASADAKARPAESSGPRSMRLTLIKPVSSVEAIVTPIESPDTAA